MGLIKAVSLFEFHKILFLVGIDEVVDVVAHKVEGDIGSFALTDVNDAEGECFVASLIGLAQFGDDGSFVYFQLAVWKFGGQFHNNYCIKMRVKVNQLDFYNLLTINNRFIFVGIFGKLRVFHAVLGENVLPIHEAGFVPKHLDAALGFLGLGHCE